MLHGSHAEARFALGEEGFLRVVLDEPMDIGLPPAAQVDHIVRTARITDCNDAWAAVQGQAATSLVGRLVAELGPVVVERIQRIVNMRFTSVGTEHGFVRPDGVMRWTRNSIAPRVEGGRLVEIYLTSQDITSQKLAEQQLERRSRILQAVANCAVLLLAPGTWRQAVPAVLSTLGTAIGATRAHVFEFHGPKDAMHVSERFEWTAEGVPAIMQRPDRQDVDMRELGLGEWEDLLRAGEPILADVARLADGPRSMFERAGVGSLASVPVFVGGSLWGALTFDDAGGEQAWSDAEVDALRAAASCLGAALEREAADAALRAADRQYRDIVELSPLGICQTTPDGKIVTANAAFMELLGYTSLDEMRGVNMGRDVYADPEGRRRLQQVYADAPRLIGLEVLWKRRDGTPFWAKITTQKLVDHGGVLRGYEAFVHDITEERAAVAALAESEKRYRVLFDGNPLPMLVYDLESLRFLAANDAAVQQYGCSREELLELEVGDLVVPGDPHYTTFLAHRHEPRPDLVRVGARQQRRRDGTVVDVEVTSLAISFDGRAARLLVAPDVTESLCAERAIAELQDSLRRTESMSRMGALVAGVAHEVRNPLFSISATVDALEGELGPSPAYAEFAPLLRAQVGRLSTLMRDLLDYGKPAVLNPAAFQASDLLRRAVRSSALVCHTHAVEVVEDVAPDLPTLHGDLGRLQQVIENLVTNAAQLSPRGTTVRVSAAAVADGVRFEVRDQGPGIPVDDFPVLFDPFHTRRPGGTGLGLPIAQRIVEAHGARLTAANRPDGGAVFGFTLR